MLAIVRTADAGAIQDPPEGFILNYTLLIGDASFSNFQKVANDRF